MLRASCFWSLLMTAGVIVACDGGGGSGGTGSAQGPLDSFITQYCDLYSPCCAKTGKAYDQGKCRALFTALTGTSTYDAAKGDQCLTAARAESGNATFCTDGLSDAANTTCEGVLVKGSSGGAKKPGEACEDDSECASTADGEGNCTSSFSKDTTTRQCQLQARGKDGEEGCIGEKDGNTTSTSVSSDAPPATRAVICWTADGLFCDDKTKKCSKIQAVGGPCDSFSNYACVKTAYCDTSAKLCTARKNVGEACTSFRAQCADKHFCDDKSKTCAPMIPAGQPCTRNAECEGGCTNGKCGSSGSSSSVTAFVCVQ